MPLVDAIDAALDAENAALRRDLDDVKARALRVNRGLRADNYTMRDALSQAVAAKEAAEQKFRALNDIQLREGTELRDSLTATETALAEAQAALREAGKAGIVLAEMFEVYWTVKDTHEAVHAAVAMWRQALAIPAMQQALAAGGAQGGA